MKTKNAITGIILLSVLIAFSPLRADESAVDDGIVSSIESVIALEDNLSESEISVTSHDGVVTLQGEVNSIAEKNHLIDIVQSTSGVVQINTDNLTVGE